MRACPDVDANFLLSRSHYLCRMLLKGNKVIIGVARFYISTYGGTGRHVELKILFPMEYEFDSR